MKRFEIGPNLPNYFKGIDKLEAKLSLSQELDLAKRIQDGDETAFTKLVEANLKFVVTLANDFIGMGVGIEDLIQAGNMGLMKAARKYTPDKQVKFITYAQFWIRKYLNGELCANGRIVRLPINQEYDIFKRKKKGEDVNLSNVDLDKPIGDDGHNTIGDIALSTGMPEPFKNKEQDELVNSLLNTLNDKQRNIVDMFFGLSEDKLTMKEIADRLEITPVEVSKVLRSAKNIMRKHSKICETYLQ